MAIPYIKQHPETPVIVSGGQGADEPATEAAVMKQYLLNKGVPENRFLRKSCHTHQRKYCQFTKLLSFKRLVIVTSDFHMYRSQLLAKRAGISNVSGITAASSFPKDIKNFGRELLSLGYALLFDWKERPSQDHFAKDAFIFCGFAHFCSLLLVFKL